MPSEMQMVDTAVSYTPDIPQQPVPDYSNINQGTVAIEASRAIAEAQGKLVIAKQFPRNEVAAHQRVMDACRRPALAQKAFYSYPRAGGTVKGLSIRAAEEFARCWGNMDYGIKELSQEDGKSEMQAYAWDLETNTMSVQNFTNPHFKEVGKSIKKLESLRDIYENNANMGARRLRSRILAILPADLVEAAIKECEKTIKGDNSIPLIDRIKTMVVQFGKLGVSAEMLETRLGKKTDQMNGDEYVEYSGIYNSLKDKEKSIKDWFDSPTVASDLTQDINKALEGGQRKLGG